MTYLTMNAVFNLERVELISSGCLVTLEEIIAILSKNMEKDTAQVYLYNVQGGFEVRVMDKKVQLSIWEPSGLLKSLIYMIDTVDASVLSQWVVSPIIMGVKYEDVNRALSYMTASIKGDI
jgi:hypothetical protein